MMPDDGVRGGSGIGVVIPQYCGSVMTARCCRELLEVHRRPLEVVVVDDGSGVEEVKRLRLMLPEEVRVIGRPRAGITAAWNAGIHALERSSVVVLLNNDVTTVGPWLEGVEELLQEDPLRLIGAEWYAEISRQRLERRYRIPGVQGKLLAGWCLAFTRGAARNVGPFDERMTWYWSDTDWQFRWLRMYGRRREVLKVIPAGAVVHAGQRTTRSQPERRERWRADGAIFCGKWPASTGVEF